VRLLLAQDVMRAQHDIKHRLVEFQQGEWVWLRLQHRAASGITPLRPNKLSPRFYGPYQILEHIGSSTYKLQLPAKAKIHDVFHVALLKKFDGEPPSAIVALPPIQHGCVIPTPEKVLRARLNRSNWELMVSWQGQSSNSTTWEKLTKFRAAYLEVQLKDALFLDEGRNVVDSFIGKVYQRWRPSREEAEAVVR
jgi:hypothetical protein